MLDGLEEGGRRRPSSSSLSIRGRLKPEGGVLLSRWRLCRFKGSIQKKFKIGY
jgi:hypothetical protein